MGHEPRTPDPVTDQRNHDQLKVLMVDPSGATAGVTHNLCNALVQQGCEVHFFTGPHWNHTVARSGQVLYQPIIDYCRYSQIRAYEATRAIPRLYWHIVRFAEHLASMRRLVTLIPDFDVVHVQWLPLPRLDVYFLRQMSGGPCLAYTVHNLLPHGKRHSSRSRRLYQRIYRIPDVLFAHTAHTAEGLTDTFHVPPNLIRQVPHGSMAHLKEWSSDNSLSASNASRDRTEPVVLFFGQIRAGKGLDLLLRAGQHLRKQVPRFRIRVVGKPRVDMDQYMKLSEELDLAGHVEWDLRFVPEKEIPSVFESSSVVALPYREIDQSGVALTACTLGKPLVATRCGGLPELIEEAENGIIVPPEDPIAFAQALASLLTNEDRRRQCEDNSRHYSDEILSWKGIATNTLATYESVLSKRPIFGRERPS